MTWRLCRLWVGRVVGCFRTQRRHCPGRRWRQPWAQQRPDRSHFMLQPPVRGLAATPAIFPHCAVEPRPLGGRRTAATMPTSTWRLLSLASLLGVSCWAGALGDAASAAADGVEAGTSRGLSSDQSSSGPLKRRRRESNTCLLAASLAFWWSFSGLEHASRSARQLVRGQSLSWEMANKFCGSGPESCRQCSDPSWTLWGGLVWPGEVTLEWCPVAARRSRGTSAHVIADTLLEARPLEELAMDEPDHNFLVTGGPLAQTCKLRGRLERHWGRCGRSSLGGRCSRQGQVRHHRGGRHSRNAAAWLVWRARHAHP